LLLLGGVVLETELALDLGVEAVFVLSESLVVFQAVSLANVAGKVAVWVEGTSVREVEKR